MKIWAIILALALGMALLPSCRDKSQINNKVVVTAVGVDAGEDGECHLSIQAIETLKTSGSLTQQEDNATSVYESDGPSVAGALKSFVTTTGRNAYILHNRVIAVGMEQLQSQPLLSLIDYFIRNHEGRPLVDMVVCRGKAAELLNIPSKSYTIPAEHLSMLLNEGEKWGYVARADLLDVERAVSGMFDATLPIVNVKSEGEGEEKKQTVLMDGTAVFRNGHLAGELDEAATRGLLFGRGDIDQCLYVLEMVRQDGTEDRLTVEIHGSDTQIDVQRQGNAALFTIRISCRAEISEEYRPENWALHNLPAIEEALSRMIEQDVRAMLDATIMDMGCDVLGLCRLLQKREPRVIRGFESQWPERLRECEIRVEADARINNVGVESGENPRPVGD